MQNTLKKYIENTNSVYSRNYRGLVGNQFLNKNENVLIIVHIRKLSHKNLNKEILLSDSKEKYHKIHAKSRGKIKKILM